MIFDSFSWPEGWMQGKQTQKSPNISSGFFDNSLRFEKSLAQAWPTDKSFGVQVDETCFARPHFHPTTTMDGGSADYAGAFICLTHDRMLTSSALLTYPCSSFLRTQKSPNISSGFFVYLKPGSGPGFHRAQSVQTGETRFAVNRFHPTRE